MGSTNQTFQSNPYADFDPSQYSNPYSQFSGALPFPSSYAGWPTDAMGNPIAKPPGMTLNSQPAPAPAPAAAPQSNIPQFLAYGGGSGTGGAAGGENALGSGQVPGGQQSLGGYMVNPAYAIQQMQQSAGNQVANADKGSFGGWSPTGQMLPGQQQQAQAGPQAPAVNNAGLTAQQYLQLKANPGPVSNPGATVPQATSTAGGPGVLQHFLANWNPAQSGPGAGFQQGFAKSLKGLGY
jgi:hypothetical protein